jgi:MFS family permease
MLVIIDNSVTFNALSGLVITFHSSVRSVQLVNSMYPLVAGAFMLAGGLLGMRIGWKSLLLYGLLIISAGELLAWFSPDLMVLTWGARVLAGLGGSLAISAAIGLIPANYKGKDMAISFGVLGGAIGVASSAGPILGGYIIDAFSWRTAYLMLAIAFGLGLILAFALPKVKNPVPKFKFDFVGTILFAIGIILLTLGLVNIHAWPIAMFMAFFVGGLLIISLFAWYESKREKKNIPVLMPRVFFGSKGSRDWLVMTTLTYFISGGLSFAMITFLQVVKGYNALQTGLIMSIYALGIIIFSI